jgi:hypothetical protein
MLPLQWRLNGRALKVATGLVGLALAVSHDACTPTSALTFDGGEDATSEGTGSGDATPGSDSGENGGDAANPACAFDRGGSQFNNGCVFGP